MDDKRNEQEKVQYVIREVLDRLKRGEGGSGNSEGEYVITEEALLRDFSVFADDVFDASVEPTPQGLLLVFKNGQTFMVSVKEQVFQVE